MRSMGKKSKRHQAQGGAQKTAPGAVINNKAVCRAVDELWASKPGSWQEILRMNMKFFVGQIIRSMVW